jgi:hypothetical protein
MTKRKGLIWFASLVAAATLAAAANAVPTPAPFTWNPAAAGLTGSAFTADTIYVTGYVRDNGTTSDRIEIVTGFSLNGGATFTPAGLGSTYGLYFQTIDQGIHGPPPDILTFTSVDLKLKADPGNLNGAVISTPTAFHFTNTGQTGEADDILLATGALVNGGVVVDLTAGIVIGDQIDTFIPGFAGFFQGGSGLVRDFASNPLSLLTMTTLPDGTTITNFNGIAETYQFVPEPASFALLGTGLFGLLTLSRRSRRRQ